MQILSTPVSLHDSTCTFLVKHGEQFGIRWAGCFYGPADSIDKVANGDLLAECLAKLADPKTVWTAQKLVDDDELGPILPSDFGGGDDCFD